MEPEDLPWPTELEEEEEEERENLDQEEVVMVEEVEEEERPELRSDFNNREFQHRESTDEEVEEEDDEARAWLQAPPIRALPPPPPLKCRFSEGERACSEKVVPLTGHVWQQSLYQDNNRTQISNTDVVSFETTQWGSGNDQRTESWHCLPQEPNSSQTLVTTHTRFNLRDEGTEVTDFPSVEEGTLSQSENQVKEHSRDFLYSPLLVIQENFASPDLPLLTYLARDQEYEPDSLSYQSDLHFEPLRGIPDRSEDTGWLSRPSEVKEALFQAASEVVSELVNSCFSVSHHPVIGSSDTGLQHSFLPPEQGNKEETISSHEADEPNPHKDSDSCDTLCSHTSWKAKEVIEQPETKDQVSVSNSSDISTKGSDSFDASCSYAQCWEEEAFLQPETCLTSKDHDCFSGPSDTIGKNKISKGRSSYDASCLYMPWRKQGASHHPETCLTSKDHVSFPHEIASCFNNKVSNSFLPCLLERRGRGVPLTSHSHYYENVDLKAIPENEVKQKMDSLEDDKINEVLEKELSQRFEQKETRNNLVSSDIHPTYSEIQHFGNVVPDNSVKVSEASILSRRHDTSKMEASGGILHTVKFNLGEISEQLSFQEERSQKETSPFGAVVDAIESIAFEAVIASIEPSKREKTINEIQTDINKPLTNASQEREPKIPDLSPSNYDEKSLFDQLSHPRYQSTPAIFEPATSKSWLHKKHVVDSSPYSHPNLKSSSSPQEMFIESFSVIPELKSSTSLSEKSHNQTVGHSKTESLLFRCDISNESFLPIGKIKSDPALDLTEKVESSNIYLPRVSTSDSLVLQDLKQQTSEEDVDSLNYVLVKHVNSDNIIEGRSTAVGSTSSANLVAYDEKLQSASPSASDASLIALLPKADVNQGEIPQNVEAKSCFIIHTDVQKDSCCVEYLQGKVESDIITPNDDTECHSLDEHAVAYSERIAELLKEDARSTFPICDHEKCLQVGGSNVGINQDFSSVLPHEPTREPEYHSSDLRMLRLFLETVPQTLKYLTGNTSKGGTAEITQSNLKTGTTANSEDSDFGSDISLPTEALPQLTVRSPQKKTTGQHIDDFLQQPLLHSHLNEDTLKASTVPETYGQKTGISAVVFPSSYGLREKLGKSTFCQQGLLSSHSAEENLKISHVPGPADQMTRTPTVPSSSFSHREEPSLFYQQELPDSHLTEEALKVSALPGPADQKFGTPTVIPVSSSQREKPNIFYQQELPGSHLTEDPLKSSAVSAEQKTRTPTIPSSSYSHREKPNIFYQQELPESHLPEVTLKNSALSGPSDQETGIPTIPFSSNSHKEKPNIFYQQELPDSHFTEVALKNSAVSGPANQKTEMPTRPPCSCSEREKPSVSLSQQVLSDSHPAEEDLKVSPVPGETDQNSGVPTIPCSSCFLREMPAILYQQLLPDINLPEVGLTNSAVPESADQKTGMPTVPYDSYTQREKPTILYHQVLPGNHLTEVAVKSSSVSGPANHETGTPTVPSGSYKHIEKPTILYQQVLPDSHLTEQDLKVSSVPGPTDQNTGTHREMSAILPQQHFPDNHLSELNLKTSPVSEPADQKTELPTVPYGSNSFREKPIILYHQVLPDSHLTGKDLKVSPVPGQTDQKTGTPREMPTILHQQLLPDIHLSEVGPKSSAVLGSADQETGMPIVFLASYSQREKPIVLYHQVLPDNHLSEVAVKISAVSGPADQMTEVRTVPSGSYAHRAEPTIFYQQVLPDSHLTEQDLKVSPVRGPTDPMTGTYREIPTVLYPQVLLDSHLSETSLKSLAVPGSADQKSGTSRGPPDSCSFQEKPTVLYQLLLPDSHVAEVALKSSVVSWPSDQKTGMSTVPADLYTHTEMPTVISQHGLSDSHLDEDDIKISPATGPSDQKIRISTEPPSSYSHGEKPRIFYQQELSDIHLTEEVVKSSTFTGLADQKTETPTISPGSYSQKEKPSLFYQEVLPVNQISEVALKSLDVSISVEQKTGTPNVFPGSYTPGDIPIILHQQALPVSHLTEETLKSSTFPGLADQKTEISTMPPGSYSDREKPILLYQQVIPEDHLIEEALKVSAAPGQSDQKTGMPIIQRDLAKEELKVFDVPGPVEQKTHMPAVPPAPYALREKSTIFYKQLSPDSYISEIILKSSALPELSDPMTGMPAVLPGSYSHKEKLDIFYQQELSDIHPTEVILKNSTTPVPTDQKTEIPTLHLNSCSLRQKPIIHQQVLPDGHLPVVPLKSLTFPGPAEQKPGIPILPPDSSYQREMPSILYQQVLSDGHLTDESLKVPAVPEPDDQRSAIPSVPPSSYPHREKPNIFYQQVLTDNPLTEEALEVLSVSGLAEQKTGKPIVPSSSYSHEEKLDILYQQTLPDSHLTEVALESSTVPGSADQESSSSYSHRDKPSTLHQQALPDSHLTEDSLKVLAIPESVDEKSGIQTVSSSSSSYREKPSILHQQALPDSHLTEESLKVPAVPGSADQKTGIPSVPLGFYSYSEKPSVFSQQAFVDGHLTEEALKVSAVPGPTDQKIGTPTVSSSSSSHREKPNVFYQNRLPDGYFTDEDLKVSVLSVLADENTGIPTVPPGASSCREKTSVLYPQEFPHSHITEAVLKDPAVPGPADQKPGIQTVPPSAYSHSDKPVILHQQELPNNLITEEALKISTVPGLPNQNTGLLIGPSNSNSHKEKFEISTVIAPDDQKTGLPTTPPRSCLHREKAKVSFLIGPDEHKSPLLTVFSSSSSEREKRSVCFQQKLPDRKQNEDILKVSAAPETDGNTEIPVSLSSSSSHREKSNILYPRELPSRHLNEDVLKVSAHLGPAEQKTVLPKALPSSSRRENPNIFCQPDVPDRHVTEDAQKVSSVLGQADQITVLPTISSGTHSHSEKYKVRSERVQRLQNILDSSESSITSNSRPLNSQADGRVAINKPVLLGFGDLCSEEPRNMDSSSKTLKEIRTLLMEAENIALKRCNVPAPLVPFRDVRDISYIQSKKVVCFKEPSITDSNGDKLQKHPFLEESPSNRCIQKDINTETNVKCQRDIENWEFISSTTVRSPLQEAERKAGAALEETLKHYEAAKYVMRSEPEGCSGTIGNKIVFPMMTIIKSDSSSDTSDGNVSCSWDSNFPESLGSVSDVLLNFFPDASPNTSMTDSREEEGISESDDGGSSSIDSLAAHVKNLLQCESSLNHAKQILRDAEEEECRVRAHAWNLKFNLAHDCGYSISALNDDDRRKVEEIKAKLFGHGRTTNLSKGLHSPQKIGCKPEAVCSHIIIESHEKGCFRTLNAEEPQLDSHSCIFRSAEPPEMTRGRGSPSLWRARNINLSKSLEQSTSHFKVWNSLHLRSHSPFQNFTTDSSKISKGLQMPLCEKMDPWLSELVEPACVPSEEVDFHFSSQMPPPEPMTKFTTSITFSSHRHSKCISDSSVFKVGVTEGSQGTGTSVGVFNSLVAEKQSTLSDQKQNTSSPSTFKMLSYSPSKDETILAENVRQSQELPVDFEHSHQEEKLLEISDFKGSNSECSPSANCSNFKEIQFSGNHTLISMDKLSSTLGVKEKNVTVSPDPPSPIFLEQRELFEQSKAPHTDHHERKHPSPLSQRQDYIAPNLPSPIFLEQRELFEQSKAPHADHHVRKHHSPLLQGQDHMASDLPSPIFLEQRELFEQSRAPHVHHHVREHPSPLPQGQDCVVEQDNQYILKSHTSNLTNVEAKFNNVSQLVPNHCTLVTSASTPPSNRKILSCVHITLSPKTPSSLDSGTLGKRLHSLDPASKTRMNSEFNSDLQTVSSKSLEPTSKLLTIKPIAQDQESLGFLGPKSSLDFQIVQSTLADSNNSVTQNLKNIPSQNSQLVTSRQTQVNFSDLEEYSNPEGTPVSADRSPEEIKTPFSAFSGKLSSDAVTQITTESPEKTMFSSEIFINAEDRGHEIPGPFTQKVYSVPVKFASSSIQQIAPSHGTAQPLLLPYKPSGGTEMYYVPQLRKIPQFLDAKSDTTVESSHSGSNDAIAPDFPAQVLGTRDDDLSNTVNIRHKEGIYSKRAVTKTSWSVVKKPFQKETADATVQVAATRNENLSGAKQMEDIYIKRAVTQVAQPEEEEILQNDAAGCSGLAAAELSAQVQDAKTENLPDTKAIEEKEEIYNKGAVPKVAWPEENELLQIDTAESRGQSEFENTARSVFRSAQFYFHPPVHLPSDQDICHESLGRSAFMRHAYLPPCYQNMDKSNRKDYAKIESLSINFNIGNKEAIHSTKSQTRDNPKCNRQINDPKRDYKLTPEPTTQRAMSLNELWNRYQERQRQQKPPKIRDRKELSLVERLDRLAKLLQNPITHSLQASEHTHDYSRGERDVKEWRSRQQRQKNKLQKKKRYKSLNKGLNKTGDLKKNKVLSPCQAGRSNQINTEQIKFDKYVVTKQPGFNYLSNTSSDSRPSEDSELLTDTATNILSTTTSPGESDILTQTDKEVALPERSSSVSTIDTARLVQAFGHERVCLSPRQIKLYSSITNQQKKCLEKRTKLSKKEVNTGHFQITSEHTRRENIQVEKHMISSESISSSASSFWSSTPTLSSKQNVQMLNKGIQAGNLEIVNGAKKHTRDVGMTFPTPSSSEARLEDDSDMNSSQTEEKNEEKRLVTFYLREKKLRKNKPNSCEGVSWFIPVENLKSGSKKENLLCGPGVSWFEPITNTKPWREPLREKNCQGQQMDSRGFLAGPGRDFDTIPPKPFVRASLQESLQFHRPDFISRSGERIKRLKLIVQERKLQNVLQSERDALFNTARGWPGYRDPAHPGPLRGFPAAHKYRPVGKKEMIQRSKRIYEQLPEVQKKREEEKRRSEYKSNRLRAQLFKKKVTNRLLGRKVPWD
ncbi:centrosome-associated protein ALMS1 isoform X2 [Tamandua tetradactyla]|uniref:centrosome-associated protein ALMS1 isoform X2 n=1 Tax=Tamandua tetradactyla TaxID=48850 RepID=UPI004054944F